MRWSWAGSDGRARQRRVPRFATASSKQSPISRTPSPVRGHQSRPPVRSSARSRICWESASLVSSSSPTGATPRPVFMRSWTASRRPGGGPARRPPQRAVRHCERRFRRGTRDGLRHQQLDANQPAAGGAGRCAQRRLGADGRGRAGDRRAHLRLDRREADLPGRRARAPAGDCLRGGTRPRPDPLGGGALRRAGPRAADRGRGAADPVAVRPGCGADRRA